MAHIEIDKKPVIFDDLEYCRTYKGEFDHMKTEKKCSLFNNEKLDHAEITYYIIKCDECKAAWKKVKNKTMEPSEAAALGYT